MGFFSWKTQDTNRSISNMHSTRSAFTVVMHDNKGNTWTETSYDGYGEFGGKDYYELLAEMNGLTTRKEGIDLAYSGKPCLHPNLTESKMWGWINEKPEDCEYQGYFYDDEDDDDYNEYDDRSFDEDDEDDDNSF